MRRRIPLAALAPLLLLAPHALADPPTNTQKGAFVSDSARLMGTQFRVIAWVETPAQRAVVKLALDDVAFLEALWSPWVEGSDITRINRAAGIEMVTVEPRTTDLIVRSKQQCLQTAGAFDPTFYALSGLYNLRDPAFTPPTAAQIAEKLVLVGCAHIHVDAATNRVGLAKPGVKIHLGGNAKGTALDVAAKRLASAGIARFVVDGGGDIVVRGEGPKGPWRVGIQHPREARGQVVGMAATSGGAVATSGDYERFVVVDGKRYHHIVDPRTGLPASGCRSSTVTVPPGDHAGEIADSLATALCVLGPEAGLAVLKTVPGATAALIDRHGAVHRSDDFQGWISDAPGPQASANGQHR
jgi:thiamine biosynthesis lipoprotein